MLSLLTAAAVAADQPTIAVVGLHEGPLDLTAQIAVSNALAARIEASNEFDALGHVDLARRIAGRETIIVEDAVLGPGRRLLDDGRSLWSQAQPDQAVPVLDDAIAALRSAMVVGVSSRDLWDAYMVKGMAERDLGDDEATNTAWEAAVAAAPTRNPDPATYPPDVVSAYDRLRGDLLAEGATLEIDASVTGARILLDGEPRGTAPVSLTGIAPGTHTVVAIAADGSRGATTFDADAGTPTTIRVALGPPTLGEASTSSIGRARQIGALYRAFGSRADVDLVLVAGIVDVELRLQLYSVKANAFSQVIAVPYEGDASDEAVVAVPQLLELLEAGALPVDRSVANAIPSDIAANVLLSRLLLARETLPGLVEVVEEDRPKWLVPVVAGVGVLVAGSVAAGVAATSGGDHGTITVTLP
jgi:hypothetical protein